MDESDLRRFRRAYWQATRELDTLRLRQWERSRVTLPQLRVLHQVRRTPGITTRDLARALGITVSTTSGLVIKLVDRGLIERTTAPDDRRQAPLRLSEAGAALIGELVGAGRPFIEAVAALLGPDLGRVTEALELLAGVAARARIDTAEDEQEEAVPSASDAAPAGGGV